MGFNPGGHAFSAGSRERWATTTTLALVSILASALILRCVLVAVLRGRQTHDLRIFVSWANLLARYGSHGLYAHVDTIDHYPVNYPPVYALSLAAVVALHRLIVRGGPQNDLLLGMLLKLPAIAADLALCGLAFVIVRRWLGSRPALFAAVLAAFAPSTWPVSALWGQVDSLCSAFIMLSLALALQCRFVPAWGALAIAILVKPFRSRSRHCYSQRKLETRVGPFAFSQDPHAHSSSRM